MRMASGPRLSKLAPFFDLRTALAFLEAHDELTNVVGEVDWDVELGTVTREVYRRKGPALLFSNITNYNETGARCSAVATGIFASFRRIALMLGFDDRVSNRTLIEYVLHKNATLVPPVVVESGPVFEHVLMGTDVDLFDFPSPRWHHLDGGRYIATMGCIVSKDPDTDKVNVGIYRGMVTTKNKMGVLMVNSQHWGQHFAKYCARGENMPVACVFGWDPIMEFIAGSPMPPGVCEWDVMGGYREAPVPLVKCKTVDLEVPASAEIVFEGFISTDQSTYMMEGPFAEFTGYLSDLPTLRPVLEVTAIMHRTKPILRGTLEGSLPSASGENSFMSAIQRAAIAWRILQVAGIPGILDVYIHPVNNGTTVIVQIKKTYEGQPKQIAAALWGSGASLSRYKIVIVVDEDIDPSDYEAVDWAINYRLNPGSDDLVIYPGTFGSTLDPSTPLEERSVPNLGAGLWNRLLLDATKTFRFPRRPEWGGDRFPPVITNRPEDVAKVERRWKEYRFTNWDRDF